MAAIFASAIFGRNEPPILLIRSRLEECVLKYSSLCATSLKGKVTYNNFEMLLLFPNLRLMSTCCRWWPWYWYVVTIDHLDIRSSYHTPFRSVWNWFRLGFGARCCDVQHTNTGKYPFVALGFWQIRMENLFLVPSEIGTTLITAVLCPQTTISLMFHEQKMENTVVLPSSLVHIHRICKTNNYALVAHSRI